MPEDGLGGHATRQAPPAEMTPTGRRSSDICAGNPARLSRAFPTAVLDNSGGPPRGGEPGPRLSQETTV
jgi:hypothetical protein